MHLVFASFAVLLLLPPTQLHVQTSLTRLFCFFGGPPMTTWRPVQSMCDAPIHTCCFPPPPSSTFISDSEVSRTSSPPTSQAGGHPPPSLFYSRIPIHRVARRPQLLLRYPIDFLCTPTLSCPPTSCCSPSSFSLPGHFGTRPRGGAGS